MADLTSLTNSVKGDVITADDAAYPAAIARWAKNAERNAKVVVFVKDAQDVAAAITYAKEHKLPFAIRGGGHNAAGASSIADGLVVDLSKYLNTVRVDQEAKLGYVGGGALWRDVDAEAIKYGLATVGGTVNHTGVAGLTVGGGYGWLSGRYGLALDNLRQVTVVTADGSVLTANEKGNSDLLWGIRGGGSNFGVVTEFVFQLYPQRRTVYAGPVIYSADKLEQIVELIKTWWPNIKPDEAIIQLLTYQDGQPLVLLFLFYNGSESEGRENFKAFLDIEHILDGAKEIPYEALNSIQNTDKNEHGRCYYFKGTSQKGPDFTPTLEALNKCKEVGETGQFIPAVIYEYLPLNKINSVPISSTAFKRQTVPNVLLLLVWDDDVERTGKARGATTEFINIVNKDQALSDGEKFGYTNYDMEASESLNDRASPGVDNKARQAFGSNYAKLQEVKKRYDPEVFFNRWFPISPAA